MKNKFIALALITLSVATTTVSCTKDENPISAQNVATSDLKVEIKTDEAQNMASMSVGEPQSGNVKRGNLHAWIRTINMKAKSLDLNYEVSKTFTLVDNPLGGGQMGGTLSSSFDINKVAVGKNRIEVSTTTSTLPNFHTEWSTTPTEYLMGEFTPRPPYAVYSAVVDEAIVVQGGLNALPNIHLTTQNGRAIGLFQISQHLKDLGVWAIVTPVVNGVTKPDFSMDVHLNGVAYWSDEQSVAGAKIYFTVQLMLPNGQPFAPTQFGTTEITIVASKSINKIYTVKADGLTENSASQTFTAQPWTSDTSGEEINILPSN